MIDWNNFQTWQLVLPPSRPDTEQLMRIRLLLREIDRNEPVCILGSTPEFRDICHEMGFLNIYVFDKNPSFYEKTKQMMFYPAMTEILVEGDWLETLPHYKNLFAVILSDLTMGNIGYGSRDLFYGRVNDALKRDGFLIDKVLMHSYFLDVSDLLNKYSKKPLNLQTANTFNCQMVFCSKLIEKMNVVDTSAIYDYLNKIENCEWIKPLLELTKKITPEGCIWYYGKKRADVEKSYLSHFRILDCWEEPVNSPYYTFVHHYLFGKKCD